MSNYTSYIIFWMVMFVILGAFWYVLDRRHGVKWYRFWFRMTHKDPLPDDVVVGFIYNRRSRHKVVMATILSTLQTFIALFSVDTLNLLVELILWIVEIPMTMVGFAIGPLVFKIWRRKDEMLDAVDDLEQKYLGGDEERKPEPKVESKPEPEPPVEEKKEEVKPEPVEEKPKEEPAPEKKDDDDDDEPPDPRAMFEKYTKR